MPVDDEKVLAFNRDQRRHEVIVGHLVREFCNTLMAEVLAHDLSKWDEDEYWTFVEARDTLNASRDGQDPGYQEQLMSEAIQNHVTLNHHHPEAWIGNMPLVQVIIMYFDWRSRCVQRHVGMGDFWAHNIGKLHHDLRARAVVEMMLFDDDGSVPKHVSDLLLDELSEIPVRAI